MTAIGMREWHGEDKEAGDDDNGEKEMERWNGSGDIARQAESQSRVEPSAIGNEEASRMASGACAAVRDCERDGGTAIAVCGRGRGGGRGRVESKVWQGQRGSVDDQTLLNHVDESEPSNVFHLLNTPSHFQNDVFY